MATTDYRRAARAAAKRYGLDPHIFERQINQESGFNPNAGSSAGAIGIAQFMPGTARGLGINPRDPHQALNGAAKLMAGYVKKYGSYANALRAYNAGEGAIEKSKGYKETNAYVANILNGRDPGKIGKSTSTPSKTVTTPGSPGSTKTDTQAAITDALLHRRTGRGLLQAVLTNVNSGAYDTTTPGTPSKTVTTPGTRAAGTRAATAATGSKGTANFEGKKVAGWIAPILAYARAHGWKGQVNSGFRSLAEQTHIYNSGVRPAAKPGTSNHEGADYPRGAIDVSEAAQLSAILRKSPYGHKLVWAGSKDPVHFSHPHNGSY